MSVFYHFVRSDEVAHLHDVGVQCMVVQEERGKGEDCQQGYGHPLVLHQILHVGVLEDVVVGYVVSDVAAFHPAIGEAVHERTHKPVAEIEL